MRSTLSSRIALVVTLIIGLAVALTVLLNYFKLAQTLAGVAETRLAFTAGDLRGRIEAGLDLGLELTAMANVEAIVASEAAGDQKVLAVTVFDAAGRVLFAAGPQAPTLGQPVPEAWLAATRQDAEWRAEAEDALLVGARLTNDFGALAGGVALVYSRSALDLLLRSVLWVLVPVGIGCVLVAVILAWAISAALFRRTERRLRRTREALAATLGDEPAAEPGDPETAAIRAKLTSILAEIASAGEQVARLGAKG